MKQTPGYALLIAVGLLIFALAAPPASAAQEARAVQEPAVIEAEEDPVLDAQVKEIASKLRCPTCRALSVQDSPAEMAREMRSLIREQLQAGKSRDEIIAYFVDRYGEWILLKPPAHGFNWTVWLLPILMLAGGLFFVFLIARRWVEQGQARAATLTGEGEEGDV